MRQVSIVMEHVGSHSRQRKCDLLFVFPFRICLPPFEQYPNGGAFYFGSSDRSLFNCIRWKSILEIAVRHGRVDGA